jgi:nucleoside-diphosphate-sugar epimerase
MRVLLAGATGTLGAPLVAALQSAGHVVVGITRTPEGASKLAARTVQPVLADVLDRDALLRAVDGLKADAVIHELTALKKAPAAFAGMRETNRLRVDGTAHLVEAAASIGATRFVTQSIAFGYGFGDSGSTPLTEQSAFGVVGPDDDQRTIPVAEALVSTEQQAFATGGGIALRYGLFYGLDVPVMQRMLNRFSLPVPRTWRGSIPFIHHEDAAAATVAAIERGEPGRAYNIADDGDTSWCEFVEAVAAATGARRPLALPDGLIRAIAPYAGVMMTRLNLHVSTALARQQLGWEPRYRTVSEGVAAAGRGAATSG